MKNFDDLMKLLDSNDVFIDDKNSDMFKLSTLLKDVFKAGAQSKQAEIDELQARIDEALRFYNEAKSPHNIGMIQMAILLKGTTNEQ